MNLTGVGGEERGIGAARHLEAAGQGLVMAGHPFGDVGHRQIAHDPLPGHVLDLERLGQALEGPADVAVVEHHPLGRPGGARRVDQGGEVFGLGGLGRVGEVERVRCQQGLVGEIGPRVVVVDDADLLERGDRLANLADRLVEASILDHRELRRGVVGEILDLLR